MYSSISMRRCPSIGHYLESRDHVDYITDTHTHSLAYRFDHCGVSERRRNGHHYIRVTCITTYRHYSTYSSLPPSLPAPPLPASMLFSSHYSISCRPLLDIAGTRCYSLPIVILPPILIPQYRLLDVIILTLLDFLICYL